MGWRTLSTTQQQAACAPGRDTQSAGSRAAPGQVDGQRSDIHALTAKFLLTSYYCIPPDSGCPQPQAVVCGLSPPRPELRGALGMVEEQELPEEQAEAPEEAGSEDHEDDESHFESEAAEGSNGDGGEHGKKRKKKKKARPAACVAGRPPHPARPPPLLFSPAGSSLC